jgi:hypothetical protein
MLRAALFRRTRMTEMTNEALADVIYHGGSILTMAD